MTPSGKEYSAFRHLASAIRANPDTLFTMLTCYFDEAGGKSHGFTIVAGWVASVTEWDRFEANWRILLAKYDVPHLNMKQYAAFKGPFAKWKPDRMAGTRASFLREASTIIDETVRVGVFCYVYHREFHNVDRYYEFSEIFPSPYALAARSCIAEANEWRRSNVSGPLDMKYVFEDGDGGKDEGPDKSGLRHSMRALIPYLPDPIFEPGHDWKRSQKWPDGRIGIRQLQSADYLAYEIRKFISDHPEVSRKEPRAFRKSLRSLPGNKVIRIFLDERKLLNLCRLGRFKMRKEPKQ